MKHLGDITSLSGASVPIVDCIIGGSPCQDLSIAGKRAGLAGERSGLFMEQIRIVKEMREYDLRMRGSVDDVRPRYMVWENVPGAFTSGNPKGADFQAVLEEIIKVKNKGAANVPIPEGGWSNAGLLMGDGFSIAWRVHDAQFWGVPQRRKRISLVADFNGGGAGEILFEPKSLSGNIDESRSEREEIAGHTSSSIGEPNAYTLQIRSGCDGGGQRSLNSD